MAHKSDPRNFDAVAWHEINLDGFTPLAGTVVSYWCPLFDPDGQATQIPINTPTDFFVRITGSNQSSLRTVLATITEMHDENPELGWLPKIGAASFTTIGTQLYAPYGQIRVRGLLEYDQPRRIGIMLHLGF